MFNISVRTVVTAAAAVILPTVLTGCADMAAGAATAPDTVSASNCQIPAQPTITADTPTIAILGVQGATLTSYDQDTALVVSAAAAMKARVIINGVTDGPDAPSLLSNVILEGEGVNHLARTTSLDCRVAKVNEAIDTLKKGESVKTPNVFDAFNNLAGNLSNNPSKQPVDVVLLLPLVAQGGGISLSNAETLADPVAAINTLAEKGLVPSCVNWRIYGVSPTVGVSDIQSGQLKDFWLRFIQKCGGKLVAWEDHLATFPATDAIAPADTSQIEVERTDKEVTATLGADVLFGPDSATLRDSASRALGELVALTSTYNGQIVITGHVNPTGSRVTKTGTSLSLQRATAVKDWLVANDVDVKRITVVGKGASEPLFPSPETDAQKAANRRVVAVIFAKD